MNGSMHVQILKFYSIILYHDIPYMHNISVLYHGIKYFAWNKKPNIILNSNMYQLKI